MDNKLANYFTMIEKTKSPSTFRAYRKDIMRFVNSFDISDNVSKVSEITKEDFRQFVYSLEMKASSANSCIKNIGAFVSWLLDNEYIESENISKTKFGTSRFMKEPKKEVISLNAEECVELIKSAHSVQDKFMIALMLTTGIRAREVVRIKISDIDYIEGVILIDGKGSKERLVAMPEKMQDMLEMYMSVRDKEKAGDYLFYSTRMDGEDGMLSSVSVNNRVKAALENTSFSNERKNQISAHKLRSTAATRMANQLPLHLVKEILGHANIATTMRYLSADGKLEAMKNQTLGF